MKKYDWLLAAGVLACSLISIPSTALASDAPTDEGNYIWQDENGDYWWRNGSEDEYIGDGNYYPDPDTGQLMEANDAGWTVQDGYFEPRYYYDNGGVWFENGDEQTYIGSRDQYYIDDYGQLQEFSQTSDGTSGSNASSGSPDSISDGSSGSDQSPSDDDMSQSTGELHLYIDFQSTDLILEAMPDTKCGYTEMRTVNEGKSTALVLKVANTEACTMGSFSDFVSEYYAINDSTDSEKALSIASYPAARFHYQTALNEDTREVDALVCQTDDYTFGLLVLTPPDAYNDEAKEAAEYLIASADLIYAGRIDFAQTDYFQVLLPERWKYLCSYETAATAQGGYTLTFSCENIPVLTLEARFCDGSEQPQDSVWQRSLGRITTWDGTEYELLATISQYSDDATEEWKELYDTCQDTINGIRIMDGCSLAYPDE